MKLLSRSFDSWLESCAAILERRESPNGLILGVALMARREGRLYGNDPLFWTVLEEERLILAALRTPPFNLLLAAEGEVTLSGSWNSWPWRSGIRNCRASRTPRLWPAGFPMHGQGATAAALA